jgi:hypothetical protein
MREVKLSFWAQSLDNVAPDDMVENNRTLDAAHVTERQDLVQRISRVSTSGERVFSEGHHSVFLSGNEIVLETPSDQLDSAGRIAPIICYAAIPDGPQESWPEDVANAQRDFAVSIGRRISDESASLARRGLEVSLKKKQRSKRRRILLYAAAVTITVVAVIAVGYWYFLRQPG